LNVGFRTDPGAAQKTNEDSLHVDEKLGLFIVADGLGGHNAGEIASHMAVQEIAASLRKGLKSKKNLAEAIQEAVAEANRAIFFTAASYPGWNEMGTTVVMALFHGKSVFISHIGDSRAYMVKNFAIKQLTQDHTFVAEWIREGSITPEKARTHKARHGLTMAIGIEEDIEPEITELAWNGEGALLLCSDGLTEALEDSEILDIVSTAATPQEACDALVKTANENGGPDNISVILIRG
jgi:serine/threonine protein phosphatase PrpC